jgi:hypothetical protein
MDGVPQSRDRLSCFMDLTLRRAKGVVQNKLRKLPWLGAPPERGLQAASAYERAWTKRLSFGLPNDEAA